MLLWTALRLLMRNHNNCVWKWVCRHRLLCRSRHHGQHHAERSDLRTGYRLYQSHDRVHPLWSKPYVQWEAAVGMISGKTQSDGKTLLDPQGNATRAEVASILMRYIQNILE